MLERIKATSAADCAARVVVDRILKGWSRAARNSPTKERLFEFISRAMPQPLGLAC
jgi:hypothetical protein